MSLVCNKKCTGLDERSGGLSHKWWYQTKRLTGLLPDLHCKAFFFLVILLSVAYSDSLNGQSFEAKIIGGFNASQLEGDNLSGFNKVGIHAGLGIQYTMYRKSISIEMLFNQKGSSTSFSLSSGRERQSTNLNYLQIPIIYSFDQWYSEEEDHYRISLEGGPYFARLFSVNSSHAVFETMTDKFRKTDLGFVIGLRYRFSHKWSAGLRYDQSFLKIFNDTNSNLTGLLSYLISFRIEYYL